MRALRLPKWLGLSPPVLPAQQAYDLWAESYPPRPHNPLMEAEQNVVAPLIATTTPSRALDVGTGTGRYLPLLAATGAPVVVGLDLSMPMLTRHLSLATRVCADGCHLPFVDRSFELVTSSLMAGDVERLSDWIAEMARVLTAGGHLIYSDFHPNWAEEGWRRTFRGPEGQLFEVGYCPHSIDAHLSALEGAALHVRTIREPRCPGHRSPVVVAFHAVKRARGPVALRPR